MAARTGLSPLIAVLLCAAAGSARAGSIVNPGFETGDFTGWTVAGSASNGQVLQASDLPDSTLTPIEGDYFALLSTGPGANSVSGFTTLTTSDTYMVNGADSSVSFFLDFLSSQPFADTPNADYFQFNVLSGAGSTTLESGDAVTDIANGTLNLIVPGSYVAAPDGTALTDHTGFGAYFVNLAAFQGQAVQFQFEVAAAAPANFADSAILVDAISDQNLTITPEPGSAFLTFAGIAVLGLTMRRKMQ